MMLQTWWALQDLNLGPMDYESTALTAELRAPGSQCSMDAGYRLTSAAV